MTKIQEILPLFKFFKKVLPQCGLEKETPKSCKNNRLKLYEELNYTKFNRNRAKFDENTAKY